LPAPARMQVPGQLTLGMHPWLRSRRDGGRWRRCSGPCPGADAWTGPWTKLRHPSLPESAVGPRRRPIGAVRSRGRLDHLLNLHLRKGLASLSPRLLDLLRQGAYELLYMGGVPDYAALSQTVSQVREAAGEGAARLANGVLRSLQREGGEVSRFPGFSQDPLAHLATWGSHPEWLVRRWLDRWEPQDVLRLVEWNNAPPPLYVRPLRGSLAEARATLEDGGWTSREVGPGIPCLLLEDGTNPALVLQVVRGIVQDPGAALVTEYADVPIGATVADLCAAPGGKALALASRGSYVLAGDASLARLRVLKGNLARVGGRMDLVVALAQAPPFREVPFVLLDVPCSGTGTFRRHPDARWRLTLDTLMRLVELQQEILDAGARLVPPGGHLLYSTCTLEPEENELQVREFLRRNRGFAVEESGVVAGEFLDRDGCLVVLPQVSGFDGAFGARMVRRA
jgi:16S rRNA (cytosine967-C5)-methyltransferase